MSLIITLVAIAIMFLWLYAIFDVLTANAEPSEKILWLLVIVVLPLIGPLLFFLIQKPKWRNDQ